jgi:arginine decarboxylase
MGNWSVRDSEELYNVPGWGVGYFGVSERGTLVMTPPDREGCAIDLKELIDDLQRQDVTLPVLVRFTDLVRARVELLVGAFANARAEWEFKGEYRGVYPIKVNQDRALLHDLVRAARPHHMGLEAGSKPELMVVLTLLDDPDAVIICNGYKDLQYIEFALLARQLGHNCIIVVERPDEIDLILEASKRLNVEPVIGIRSKLMNKGSGHWSESAGDRGKFGLTIAEIADAVAKLRAADALSRLQLLHFHIGSQIADIGPFRKALQEASRIFVELRRMGANMQYLDVGGGLGVDYEGLLRHSGSTMRYDPQEYANSVVGAITDACNKAGIPHPTIITECGRAMVAHTAALIFDVVDASRRHLHDEVVKPDPSAPPLLQDLWENYESVSLRNVLEPLHTANALREEMATRFTLGLASLEDRASAERLYWACCHRIAQTVGDDPDVPEEIEDLRRTVAETYYGNFSLFQSIPDSWALNQLFPVLPIHRLEEEPTRRAVIADLTCDSDGIIDKFADRNGYSPYLDVHEVRPGEEYYMGVFLVGAYQEILGDLHNLLGDTAAVHVTATEGGRYEVHHFVEANSVREVLEYVNYEHEEVISNFRSKVSKSVAEGRITGKDAKRWVQMFMNGMISSTYLETE